MQPILLDERDLERGQEGSPEEVAPTQSVSGETSGEPSPKLLVQGPSTPLSLFYLKWLFRLIYLSPC